MIGLQIGRIHTLSKLVLSLGIAAGIGIWTPQPAYGQAGSSSPLSSLIHRGTSVPVYEIFGSDMSQLLRQRLERVLWRQPVRTDWPLDAQGNPIVETRRLDTLIHVVKPGQTADRIRTMYRTTWSRLRSWNPDVDFRSLETGQTLVVWKRQPDAMPTSHGAPQWGHLDHGEPLPPGDTYEIIHPHRAFGTYYTISETRRTLRTYARRFPEGPRLLVGDISFRTGRSIHPHKSHRTGRDVDITYPREDEPPSWKRFYDVPLWKLDVPKTLFLVRTLLKYGYVQYIFIDRRIQRRLHERARDMGAPDAWLDAVFEYPEWDSHDSIVRHSPGHLSHMHIRFWCQPTDRRCPR